MRAPPGAQTADDDGRSRRLFGALLQVGDDGARAALGSTWVSPRLARQAPECVPALRASEDVDAVVLEFGHADDLQPGDQVGQLVAADDRRPPRCRCPGVADAEEGGAEQAPRGESAGNAGDERPQVVGPEQVQNVDRDDEAVPPRFDVEVLDVRAVQAEPGMVQFGGQFLGVRVGVDGVDGETAGQQVTGGAQGARPDVQSGSVGRAEAQHCLGDQWARSALRAVPGVGHRRAGPTSPAVSRHEAVCRQPMWRPVRPSRRR